MPTISKSFRSHALAGVSDFALAAAMIGAAGIEYLRQDARCIARVMARMGLRPS